jgi:hypothetical protein
MEVDRVDAATVNAVRPPADTGVAASDRAQRRLARTRSPIESESASTTIAMLARGLAEAERRATQAQEELELASAETQRLGAALGAVREECRRIQSRLPEIEATARGMLQRGEQERHGLGLLLRRREHERKELAARLRRREEELEQRERAHATLVEQVAEQRRMHGLVAAQLACERERVAQVAERFALEQAATEARLNEVLDRAAADHAAAEARLRDVREQAASTILVTQERAAAALVGAQETVDRVRAAGEDRVSEAYVDIDARVREAQLDAGMRVELALQDERDLRTAAEARSRHLEAELAGLRRALAREAAGPSDGELKLRAELSRADGEKAELRTRLALCIHELRERESELDHERKVADEAARWASRVERSLERDDRSVPLAGDIVLRPPSGSPTSPPRRRGPRLRLRHGS